MSVEQIKTPDIGGDSGEIIEILVREGDQVTVEQSLLVLESAKASMEVPSPTAGKVVKLHVKVGDQLEEGNLILDIEVEGESGSGREAEPEPEERAEPEKVKQAESKPKEEVSTESASGPKPKSSAASWSKSGDNGKSQLFKVPDIGSDKAEIIEVSVKPGDQVKEGDTLVVLESDKASLEIPAEATGIVESLHVKEGDEVGEGQDLVTLKLEGGEEAEEPQVSETKAAAEQKPAARPEPKKADRSEAPKAQPASAERTFQVPDLGSEDAEIIEVSVAVGDQIKAGDTLVVAESAKASLEVPAEADGEIVTLHCKVGDKISQGMDLVTLKTRAEVAEEQPAGATDSQETAEEESTERQQAEPIRTEPEPPAKPSAGGSEVYAGPAVRKLARELGVDLRQVTPSGPRGRMIKEDLQSYVKSQLQGAGATAGGGGIPAVVAVDWNKFGATRLEPMSRVHRLTAENMTRSWLNVPHVTQFDDADVTELEEYRAMIRHEGSARGIKMTPLAFILKASFKALKENPKFNASIAADGQNLVYRDYFHIGVAVDTPVGLMVPVVRDVDQKDIWALAAEVAELADKAKNGKLKPTEMQGACFTLSSLGAIGGRGFTPIVPAPQVGILGVSKTSIQPVWDGRSFQPRKLMPLALSYDHRAVNGADAGRFLTYLVEQLGSVENIWSN